jgi:acyl-CoA reductase-like NAD-dependent aldehyde dehydrogenase
MTTMGQLDDAVQAYRAAQAGLSTAKQRARDIVTSAQERERETRERLAAAIVAEAQAGTAQVDIIRRTGYARETVRTILRRGGVDPD